MSASRSSVSDAREHTVTAADGRVLRVYEAGDDDGRPVLVHNGTPSSGLLYRPWVEDAERRGFRLFGYDRPGYGGSTSQPGREMGDAAADAAAIADALGVDRFLTWGTSGGGPRALACAALLPDRVVAAVSLSATAPFAAEGLDWFAGMGQRNIAKVQAALEGYPAIQAMLEEERDALLASGPVALAEGGRSILTPVDAAVLTGELAEYLYETTVSGVRERVDGWVEDTFSFTRPWGFDPTTIGVPVLLWHGAHDRFVSDAHGAWLAERIPGVEARLSPDEGHLTLVASKVPDVHEWLDARW